MKLVSVQAVVMAMLLPAGASAQQINGLTAWTVGRGFNTFDTQSYPNNGFSQHYVLGADWPFIDARLMKLTTEGSFRTNALATGPSGTTRTGDQRTVGYRLGSALFPLRAFPLTIQASRDTVDESGNYPASSIVRGGLAMPAGEILPALQTVTQSLTASWQLKGGRLPRVDLGYSSGRASTTGSVYAAGQQQRGLHANLLKETSRLRHQFRYDANTIDNLRLSAYNQRNAEMDYELGIRLTAKSRMNVHSGRRRSYSLFDLPAQVVSGVPAGVYSVPVNGESDTRYLTSSITFEPVARLSIDTTGSLDRQRAHPTETGARLVSSSARFEVGGGLSLNAAGTYGDRAQAIGDRTITVITRSALAGSTFRTGPGWLQGSVGYNRGIGWNQTADGLIGGTESWSGQAGLSSSFRWISVSAGRDRSSARDDILDYGNAEMLRDRASIQLLAGRMAISASYENAVLDRGRDSTFSRIWQRSGSGSATFRVTRSTTLTASGGTFTSIGLAGVDTRLFAGGALSLEPVRGLRLSASARQEEATATQTRLDHLSLVWTGLAEYQVRDFTIAIEGRNTDQDLRSGLAGDRYRFRGRQLNMRVSRRLAFAL